MTNEIEFAELLNDLCLGCFSINVKVDSTDLMLVPSTEDEDLFRRITAHFETLRYLLPGVCDNCSGWTPIRVASFYGSQPAYCHVCLALAVNLFDKRNWPPVEIPDYAPIS